MDYSESPTYRYGVIIFGENYVQGDINNPEHVIMVNNLTQVEALLWSLSAHGRNTYSAENGAGETVPDTPNYGYAGDGAFVHRVNRKHQHFKEVQPAKGKRARHAYLFLDIDPTYRIRFGVSGGQTRTRLK